MGNNPNRVVSSPVYWEHDTMVKTWEAHLLNKGYLKGWINADYKDSMRVPGEIVKKTGTGNHRPDLSAVGDVVRNHGLREFIGEVETTGTIGDEHTQSQFEAFSAYAQKYQVEFWVLVPESVLEDAKQKAQEWKVFVNSWWTYDGQNIMER